MPKAVKTFVFKVQCYGMGCFGTYFTHAQRCENLRVQSATERTASVHILRMPKAVITFMFKVLWNGLLRYILYTCPKLWKPSCSKCSATEWAASVHTLHMPKGVKPSCSMCYRKDCFGTYFTHAQSCDNVHVQSATEWAASVHTLHMPKGGKTFVFKVLQKVLRQYIIYTCPKLWQRSCS